MQNLKDPRAAKTRHQRDPFPFVHLPDEVSNLAQLALDKSGGGFPMIPFISVIRKSSGGPCTPVSCGKLWEVGSYGGGWGVWLTGFAHEPAVGRRSPEINS